MHFIQNPVEKEKELFAIEKGVLQAVDGRAIVKIMYENVVIPKI